MVDQALIDQIVSNVLAQLQPAPARTDIEPPKSQPAPAAQPVPAVIELSAAVITADLLAGSARAGQPLRIGRKSILTPSARDWLNSKKIAWSRGETATTAATTAAGTTTAGTTAAGANVAGVAVGTTRSHGWQLILQSVTPGVRSLHDAMKRQPEGWLVELVGQPQEAAALAAKAISTAERSGVAVISEFAEIIACRTNRNTRVRAAVIADRRQLELTRQHLGVNLVCINPAGRTFIELRNLLRDCAAMKPVPPAGWSE